MRSGQLELRVRPSWAETGRACLRPPAPWDLVLRPVGSPRASAPTSECTRRSKPEGRSTCGRRREARDRTPPPRTYSRLVPSPRSAIRRAMRVVWRMYPRPAPQCRGTTLASQVRLGVAPVWQPGRVWHPKTLSVAGAWRAAIRFTTGVRSRWSKKRERGDIQYFTPANLHGLAISPARDPPSPSIFGGWGGHHPFRERVTNPAGSRLADLAENRRCAVPQRLGRVWKAWGARRRASASAQQSNGRFPPRGRPGLRLLDALLGHACRTQSRQNRRSAAGARSRTGALRRTGARLLASRMRGLNGAG